MFRTVRFSASLWFVAFVFGLSASVATAGLAQSPTPKPQELTTMLQQLAAEVRALKAEVQRLQLELQHEKLARLQRELQQAQTEGGRLAALRSELDFELAEVDKQLNQPALTAEERQQLETVKAELAASRLAQLHTEQQALAQREAELNRRLEQEQQRLQELLKPAGSIKL